MWMSGVGTLCAYAHYRASLLLFKTDLRKLPTLFFAMMELNFCQMIKTTKEEILAFLPPLSSYHNMRELIFFCSVILFSDNACDKRVCIYKVNRSQFRKEILLS